MQPALARGMSATLANSLIGVRPNSGDGVDDPYLSSGSQEPLQRTATADLNRQRHEDARREIAVQMMIRALPLMCGMWCICMAFLAVTVWVYTMGAVIYNRDKNKPCDRPLAPWVLTMLLIPPARCVISCGKGCFKEESQSCIQVLMLIFSVIGYPVLLFLGFRWVLHCETCQKTNEELFWFVKVFLAYHILQWIVILFLLFGCVRLLFFMHRSGLLEQGPGPHMAAKPGLINELQTVEFDRSLFSESEDDNKQPCECCICQHPFNSSTPIKQTPCGHYFHEECLGEWLGGYAKTCPICRLDLEETCERGDESV